MKYTATFVFESNPGREFEAEMDVQELERAFDEDIQNPDAEANLRLVSLQIHRGKNETKE